MRRLLCIIIVMSYVSIIEAQEYCFSQYYLDKMGISPAFVSVGDYSELGFALRSQWPGVDGGYKIFMAEYQQKLPTLSSGAGVRICGNPEGNGAFNTTAFDLLYGYDFQITYRIKCSLGLSVTYMSRKLNQDKLVYYSMIDPMSGDVSALNDVVDYQSYSSFGFSTGAVIYTKQTLLGIGLNRLTNFVISGESNYAPMVVTAIINHKIPIGGNEHYTECYIVPCINFSHSRYGDMIMPGVYFSGYKLLLSLAYRMQKSEVMSGAVVTSVGFQLGRVELVIGHDFETSGFVKETKGSYEVGAKFKFEKSEKNSEGKTILCPAF